MGPSQRVVGRERCGQPGEEELGHAGPAVPVWILASAAGSSEPAVGQVACGQPGAEEPEYRQPLAVVS